LHRGSNASTLFMVPAVLADMGLYFIRPTHAV
jgi:hypothetical protein